MMSVRLTAISSLLAICVVGTIGGETLALNLEMALEMTLSQSQELRDGQFKLHTTEVQRRLSWSDYLPSFSVGYTDYASINYDGADSQSNSMKLTLSQPIYQGGRLNANRQLLNIESERQLYQLNITANELRTACYSAYFSYLIQQRKIAHQEEIFAIAKEQLRISVTELDLGRIREIDFLEIEFEIRAMQQSLENQQLALTQAAYQLRSLLGLAPDQEFEIKDELPENYQGLVLIPEQLVHIAINTSPQITSSLYTLEQRDIEYQTSRYQWLPNISLDASVNFTGTGLPLQAVKYNLMMNLDFPLPWIPISGSISLHESPRSEYGNTKQTEAQGPEGMGYRVSKQSAELALANALSSLKSLKDDLRFSVHYATESYASLRKSLRMSREQVQLQERRLTILAKEVELGQSTRLDYVTAQNEYLEQILALLEVTLELLMAERSLEGILGVSFGSLYQFEAPS